MKKVLVAGATGYLGAFVAKELKKRAYHVRALVRSPQKLKSSVTDLDEIVQGEITAPETLDGLCEGMDVVFSSVGLTRQKDKLTFRDVDYQGNKNLLEAALDAEVKKFVYVSIFGGRELRHLDIVDAHECFVDELIASGMDYTIIRPTGFFSDLEEFLAMARKGRVFLFGSGQNRMNPIHGADLATRCVDALEGDDVEINVGGPEALTYHEIAELALEAAGKPSKITNLPVGLMKGISKAIRPFSRHQAELFSFFVAMGTRDSLAPSYGSHTLESYYRESMQ